MRLLRALGIAFSTYSILPTGKFIWNDKDMKYAAAFFPLVGVLIGAAMFLWQFICWKMGFEVMTCIPVMVVIPVIITGGIHLDGFMDCADALSSYEKKERRLEIMADPHIGAFAIIRLAVLGCLYFAVWSELINGSKLHIAYAVFFFSRILCCFSALYFPGAKQKGMLNSFFSLASRKFATFFLIVEAAVCVWFMAGVNMGKTWIVVIAGCLLLFAYYKLSRRLFGGITGDTSGYFITVSELVLLACLL